MEESRKAYVIRRAREVKRYREVAAATIGERGYEWLCKLARGQIPNPSHDRIECLFTHYQALERTGLQQEQQSTQRLAPVATCG